jgi:hypothetical protein
MGSQEKKKRDRTTPGIKRLYGSGEKGGGERTRL